MMTEVRMTDQDKIKALVEALEMVRPFVALTLTQEQAEASPRWYSKTSKALIALDAALALVRKEM